MPRKPYLIGIVGGSASGKTSFLRDLLCSAAGASLAIVSQDNYYRAIHEQERDANGQPNFDLPTAIQRDRFHEDLCKLLNGEASPRRNTPSTIPNAKASSSPSRRPRWYS